MGFSLAKHHSIQRFQAQKACGVSRFICEFYVIITTQSGYSLSARLSGRYTLQWALGVLCEQRTEYAGTFAQLRNTTVSFFMSVRPSVRTEQFGCHLMDFHET